VSTKIKALKAVFRNQAIEICASQSTRPMKGVPGKQRLDISWKRLVRVGFGQGPDILGSLSGWFIGHSGGSGVHSTAVK
jgi:hypothetical protein